MIFLKKTEEISQPKKLKYRNFNLLLLAIAFSPVFLSGIFNAMVDPYGVINSPTFAGFNLLKPAQDKNNKLFKTIDIIRLKPKTILAGSSRAILGLDPNHPGLLDHRNSYNLGIPGVHIGELSQYVKHALNNQQDMKEIVIGIDFFMFNAVSDKKENFDENLGKNFVSVEVILNNIFSGQIFDLSRLTLMKNQEFKNFNPYYSKGRRRLNTKIENETNRPMREVFQSDLTNYLSNSAYYKDYRLSNRALQEYKNIVALCQKRNITLKVFISPEPAAQLEAIRVAGLWPVYEQWKRELSKVTPLWDFSGYNSITTEPIRDDMKYFLDGTHYSKEVGDLVLNRILSYQEKTVPNDFGILVTTKNIESHLAKIRANGEVWARENPDIVKWVQELKLAQVTKRKVEIKQPSIEKK